jgi:hypothetical protein
MRNYLHLIWGHEKVCGSQPEENKQKIVQQRKKLVFCDMCDCMCNDSEELCSQVWWVYIKCSEYSGTSIYRVENSYSKEVNMRYVWNVGVCLSLPIRRNFLISNQVHPTFLYFLRTWNFYDGVKIEVLVSLSPDETALSCQWLYAQITHSPCAKMDYSPRGNEYDYVINLHKLLFFSDVLFRSCVV